MIVDTFGAPEEDRWWDKTAFERERKMVDFSKECVRQHYRAAGYHSRLMETRAVKKPEPPIAALPPEIVREVTPDVQSFETLTGQKS